MLSQVLALWIFAAFHSRGIDLWANVGNPHTGLIAANQLIAMLVSLLFRLTLASRNSESRAYDWLRIDLCVLFALGQQ